MFYGTQFALLFLTNKQTNNNQINILISIGDLLLGTDALYQSPRIDSPMRSAVDPARFFLTCLLPLLVADCSLIATQRQKIDARNWILKAAQRTFAANFQKTGSSSPRIVMNGPLPGNSSFSIWIYSANRLPVTKAQEQNDWVIRIPQHTQSAAKALWRRIPLGSLDLFSR